MHKAKHLNILLLLRSTDLLHLACIPQRTQGSGSWKIPALWHLGGWDDGKDKGQDPCYSYSADLTRRRLCYLLIKGRRWVRCLIYNQFKISEGWKCSGSKGMDSRNVPYCFAESKEKKSNASLVA